MSQSHQSDEQSEQKSSRRHNQVDVKNWSVVEDDISDGVAGALQGVGRGQAVNKQAEQEKSRADCC